VDCRQRAPALEASSLLSTLGWRLTRRIDARGEVLNDWRCPTCADRYKKQRALTGQASGFIRAVKPPSDK
jgi:hypothetical protein